MSRVLLLLATVLLAPLLILQGRAVRRRTPLLPAPPGEVTGQCGTGRCLRLLILGDSAAAGVGAMSQSEALSGQLALQLRESFDLRWQLLARSGHRASALPAELAAVGDLQFDVAVLSIGVNDVTRLASPRSFAGQVEALVKQLISHHGAKMIVLSGLPPMAEFPALPQPLRWRLGAQARALDEQLAGLAERQPRCVHLPFGPLPDPAVMASDGFHPGPAAYALWAKAVSESILSRSASLTSET